MGPSPLGPDDLLQPILEFIDGARKNLSVAVQEIDNVDITKAIIRAKKRGVSVRVILEADYLISRKEAPDPFKPEGTTFEINRQLYNSILRARIRVNSDFNPKIFHQKFIIFSS